MATTVLVTDGDQRPALAIVRALGRRGLSVVVGAASTRSLASSSKYCARAIAYPSPEQDPDGFVECLMDAVERDGIDVVMPVTDVATRAVCRRQDVMRRRCAVAVPPFDAYEAVTDKWCLVRAARRAGVPVPRTHRVDGIDELAAVLDQIDYPAVVKPVRSPIETDRGWEPAGVQYAASAAELRALFERFEYLACYPSLIQERITGPGVGVFVLADRGRLLADFAHVRLREKPPAGGVSVLRRSTAVDPALRDYAARLLGPIGWHGVAMVEFKQNVRTGEVALIEVNGRFWGSLQLAIDAGVDFAWLACELAQGHPATPAHPYRVGVTSRWLLGDLDQLLLRLFRTRGALDLGPDAPSRLRALQDFLRRGDEVHYEIESRDDPGPSRYERREYVKAFSPSIARVIRRRARPAHNAPAARSVVPAA